MQKFVQVLCKFSLPVMILLTSCGEDSPRQEQILTLRGLGVEQNPVIAKPGSVVNLTFHLADVPGKTVTATTYTDDVFRYGSNVKVTMVDTAPVEVKLNGISQWILKAQYTVPSDAATEASLAQKGSLRFRYGVAFNDGTRTERMIGDTLVYKADAPEQSWTIPSIEINEPLTAEISTTNNIATTIKNTNVENNRIRWFASSGKIKNRGAKSTEWSEISTGEQTLIATTRGDKSGSFAIKVVKVNVH